MENELIYLTEDDIEKIIDHLILNTQHQGVVERIAMLRKLQSERTKSETQADN